MHYNLFSSLAFLLVSTNYCLLKTPNASKSIRITNIYNEALDKIYLYYFKNEN